MSTIRPISRLPQRLRILLFVTLALVFLPGCLAFDILITVNTDGSGTVEQVFTMHGPMLEMLALFGEDDTTPMCDKEQLHQEAANMGKGVRLMSTKLIEKEKSKGCHAIFEFDDINTLTLNMNPENKVPGSTAGDKTDRPSSDFRFSFSPGSPASLVVYVPKNEINDPEKDDQRAPVDSEQQAQQMEMMREMLQGGHFSLAIAVDGTVTQSNATYRDDNRVTLLKIDMDQLLEDEDQLARLASANPKSPEEIKALLGGVQGIEIETREEVLIRFQ